MNQSTKHTQYTCL